MLDEFVEWLKQLSIFMLLCESILSFVPTQTYRQYIKPFVGLLLLFRIVVFLIGTTEVDWNARVDEVLSQYESSVSSYLQEQSIVDEKFKDKILNEDLIKVKAVEVEEIKIEVAK